MTGLKDKNYLQIEKSLRSISTLRRVLIVMDNEDEETVDKFISEVGAREIERTRNMNEFEVMMEMMSQIMESTKEKVNK